MGLIVAASRTHIHTSLGAWSKNLVFQTLSDASNVIESVEYVLGGETSWGDKVARELARRNNIDLTVMYANYQRYDREAVNKRNKKLALYCDAGIILSDGENKATLNILKHLLKNNRAVFVYDKPSGLYHIHEPGEDVFKISPQDFLTKVSDERVHAFYRRRAFTHNTLKGIIRASEVPEIFDGREPLDEPWDFE